MILTRPHFVLTSWAMTCRDCLQEIPQDAMMLVEVERGGQVYRCETCGRKYLETFDVAN